MTSLHELTSQEKIELGFDNKDGNDLSQRKLTAEYNISLGSVSNVLKLNCSIQFHPNSITLNLKLKTKHLFEFIQIVQT
ncbi:unnamed protein product [Rotaria sordida]|uniref:HTH psq-type domain-containing protein n=1 Tax=Rotaria sordida TaxID=392033 RepID=A0A819RXN6_9BILA|nr:unnamed protein product [Rotaria sordida]